MLDKYRIQVEYRTHERQILNALLALITGSLALVYPDLLYLIAGAYFAALGILFMAYKFPAPLSAVLIVAGIMIFILPDLIPVTLAAFLGLFGLLMLISLELTLAGVFTLIIAGLIIANPASLAYLVATFLLIYAVSNLIRFYENWQNRSQ